MGTIQLWKSEPNFISNWGIINKIAKYTPLFYTRYFNVLYCTSHTEPNLAFRLQTEFAVRNRISNLKTMWISSVNH